MELLDTDDCKIIEPVKVDSTYVEFSESGLLFVQRRARHLGIVEFRIKLLWMH